MDKSFFLKEKKDCPAPEPCLIVDQRVGIIYEVHNALVCKFLSPWMPADALDTQLWGTAALRFIQFSNIQSDKAMYKSNSDLFIC